MKSIILTLSIGFSAVAAQDAPALTLKGQIELQNVNGRIDHLSADAKNRRLFVSALGNNSVEALDIAGLKRLQTISDLAEPQGVFYDAGSNHLFVACARDGSTKVFDGQTFQILATVKLGDDADNIRYDSRVAGVIVGYGSGALGMLDSNGKRTGNIALDAHPESFQLERAGTRVFINVPDRREVEVADLAKNEVVAKWPMTSARSNFPMALDEAHHRLFLGFRAPARLVVLETQTGKEIASAEIVGDTDDLFYDATKNRIYVIGGGGFVDVFDQKDPDHYSRIAHIPTAPGARTGLFVPEWGQLFVAVPHRADQSAKVLIYETK